MKNFYCLLTLLVFPLAGFSQISISNISEIIKIKNGTTFFAMNNPDSPKAKSFVEAIKKNWTLNKVECIKYSDVEKNISPNNSFVTIGANMTSSSASSNSDAHIYLELWTTNGKFVYDPKKRKHFNQEDKISMATVELFADAYAQNNPSSLYKLDYDGAGHLKNWSPSILGNYIQQWMALLGREAVRETNTVFSNKSALANLSSQTLFAPDYVLTKFSKSSDDESKKYDQKEITEGSGLNCKFIPMAELDEKIKTGDSFYYMLFIKTNEDRYITVTNSQTGEIIYSAVSGSGNNLKSSDLKALGKK